MNKKVSVENLLSSFPTSLTTDKDQNDLANTTADKLIKLWNDNDLLAIYTRIMELEEPLLDMLAIDFKIDWWDYNYTLEQKRKTFKESFFVHKHLGTKCAVETAISTIYPGTKVEEWWKYGGNPYWFRLFIEATNVLVDSASHRRALQLLNHFKNVRSHLETITYIIRPIASEAYITSGLAGSYMSFGVELKNYVQRTLPVSVGADSAGSYMRVGVEFRNNIQRKLPISKGAKMAGTFLKVEVKLNGME